ncbi:hypothetical protein [Burkholderia vietnamiensis]|uniref:hypothetical protein n=1 Tax=Burkholderia vietnamiensis TaxID=60552 RepID=UPI000A6BFA3F|nr:hypothetical protein [Burkholderia vietnamiensis]
MIVGGSGRAVILAIADAIGNSAVERRIALASAFRKECAGGVDGAPSRATAAATGGFATRPTRYALARMTCVRY